MISTNSQQTQVPGESVSLDGERYFRIADSHLMPEFFMSLVGASDHWMFISSRGALTAGRCDPDKALFPYATDDQISAARGQTGALTLIRDMSGEDSPALERTWEPFAAHAEPAAHVRRNLYKTPLGDKLVFEEHNDALQLVFRYRWTFSEKFGFVRSCRLQNVGSRARSVELLDGLQNVLPYGVGSDFIMRFSNLANAYKKSELVAGSGLALFYLSSIPTDRAEPSEGLKATTLWQTGLNPETVLLSGSQLPAFRRGQPLRPETDVRGRPGAFLLTQALVLAAGEAIEWHQVAELAQDHSDVVAMDDWLQGTPDPLPDVESDIECGQLHLLQIVSSADAVQCGSNDRRTNRHLSNTVFNVMRGGIPLEGYRVHADDFRQHVQRFNRQTFDQHQSWLDELPAVLTATDLRTRAQATRDPDLIRLASEYLPLAFSRRHGDPTRPWNRFAINLRTDDGRTNLDYQGNWRDIFQNWEALCVSFPEFCTAMICRFVNATTADGYNPYRLTKNGFEWEEPTPDDPWANIGYWGDHQIIYLLKLLEWNARFDPRVLDELLNSASFVHANVPYRIKPFEEIRRDPQATIEFDADQSDIISQRVASVGADGKLRWTAEGSVQHVTLLEKLLTLSLTKLSNFVPDGGIWLNTQRPEWNDANNALVGNGLSVVTTCHLYRWFRFLHRQLTGSDTGFFQVTEELADFLSRVSEILREAETSVGARAEPSRRASITEALSRAGSDYRCRLYETEPGGSTTRVSRDECLEFFSSAMRHVEATIRNNKRADGLFHAYNLLDWQDDGLHLESLCEMLEGQVSALSSGLLTAAESAQLLDALRSSALYREDQDSYLLYPDRQLPRFLEKNQISIDSLSSIPLLQALLEGGDATIIKRDVRGVAHFNGSFRNAGDLHAALAGLPVEYQAAVAQDGEAVVRMFVEVFGHRRFTGRSGTFFAYEGLGSIYWHMVSKLALAVSECYFQAVEAGESVDTIAALRGHYQDIRRGIGAEKSPADYGAFPSDPYSHTPENSGVKQPGMTGQVKEDILSRFSEIGVHISDGCVDFRLELFDRRELLREPRPLTFYSLSGESRTITVPKAGFGFTLCQVPIICQAGDRDTICIRFASGEEQTIAGRQIDQATSRMLFSRSGEIDSIECRFAALRV